MRSSLVLALAARPVVVLARDIALLAERRVGRSVAVAADVRGREDGAPREGRRGGACSRRPEASSSSNSTAAATRPRWPSRLRARAARPLGRSRSKRTHDGHERHDLCSTRPLRARGSTRGTARMGSSRLSEEEGMRGEEEGLEARRGEGEEGRGSVRPAQLTACPSPTTSSRCHPTWCTTRSRRPSCSLCGAGSAEGAGQREGRRRKRAQDARRGLGRTLRAVTVRVGVRAVLVRVCSMRRSGRERAGAGERGEDGGGESARADSASRRSWGGRTVVRVLVRGRRAVS